MAGQVKQAVVWYDPARELPPDGVPVRVEYLNASGVPVVSSGVYLHMRNAIIDTQGNEFVPIEHLVQWSYDSTKPQPSFSYDWDGRCGLYKAED